MNFKISSGALALSLALTACGGEAGNNSSAAASNDAAPLENIAAPNNADWTEIVTQTPEGGFRMGNPDAPVKLVEYASLTCPHCAAFSGEAGEKLRNEYVRSGQVSFEFRNFILNAPDAAASVLARCLEPAGFFRSIEQLFADQQNWLGKLDDAAAQQVQALPPGEQLGGLARAMELDQFFRRRGMPEARVNSCLANQQEAERLAGMNQAAIDEHGISSTPSFLINNELVRDASNWTQIEAKLRAAIGS